MYSKIILILLFLFNISSIIAQDANQGVAIYQRILTYKNNSNASKDNFKLIFNNDQSLFLEIDSIVKGNVVEKSNNNTESLSLSVKVSSLVPYAVYTDFRANKIQSRLTLNSTGKKETVIVSENLKKIQWNLLNTHKNIGKLSCQKAIGSFRGRSYIAWFTNKIPVRAGPWKLNNLPGLIVEVYDDRNEVYFGLRSINISADNAKEIKLERSKEMRNLSLKEYVNESKNELENIVGVFGSKLPRGVVMNIQKTSINAIELKYDFEKN